MQINLFLPYHSDFKFFMFIVANNFYEEKLEDIQNRYSSKQLTVCKIFTYSSIIMFSIELKYFNFYQVFNI